MCRLLYIITKSLSPREWVSQGNLYWCLKFCQCTSTEDHQGHLVVKQVGFFTHCSKREHTPCRTMEYLSKNILETIIRFGLFVWFWRVSKKVEVCFKCYWKYGGQFYDWVCYRWHSHLDFVSDKIMTEPCFASFCLGFRVILCGMVSDKIVYIQQVNKMAWLWVSDQLVIILRLNCKYEISYGHKERFFLDQCQVLFNALAHRG